MQGLRKKAQHGSAALIQHVCKRIEDGTWSAGSRLPTERELEKQFGIARNTLRKAMTQLQQRGLITRHVGRGTFVADAACAQTPVHHAVDALLQRIHGASPTEVMELRLLIEPPCVELAATRATGRDLQQIAHCLRESEKATTVLDFEYWDGRLHQAMLGATHNSLLIDLYDILNSVRKQPEWEALKQRSLTPERLAHYRAQHRAVVQALRQRNAQAAGTTIRQHLLQVRLAMLGML